MAGPWWMLSSQGPTDNIWIKRQTVAGPCGCLALGDRQSIGLRESQEPFRVYGLGVLPKFHQNKLIMEFW